MYQNGSIYSLLANRSSSIREERNHNIVYSDSGGDQKRPEPRRRSVQIKRRHSAGQEEVEGGVEFISARQRCRCRSSFRCLPAFTPRSPIHSSDVLQAIDQDLVREFNSSTLGYQWQVSFDKRHTCVMFLFPDTRKKDTKLCNVSTSRSGKAYNKPIEDFRSVTNRHVSTAPPPFNQTITLRTPGVRGSSAAVGHQMPRGASC